MDKNRFPIEMKTDDLQELLQAPPKWIAKWGPFLLFALILFVFVLLFNTRIPKFIETEAIVVREDENEYLIQVKISQEQFPEIKPSQTIDFHFYMQPNTSYQGMIVSIPGNLEEDYSLSVYGIIKKTVPTAHVPSLKKGMKAKATILLATENMLHVKM